MLTNRVTYGSIFILTVVFLFQALFSMWDDSATFDETVNSSVGYFELFSGDFRLINDHPPLLRTFAALPLLAFRPNILVPRDSSRAGNRELLDRYGFAQQFFYRANDQGERMLFWSRIPVVFFSLMLGALVFQWARELYGNGAGLLAFFLYSFEPNILAHSRFATNDLIIALFIFSTIYQSWQYRNAPSLKSLILTGTLLGLGLLSKFSAVMLLPMLFLLVFLMPRPSQQNWGSGYTGTLKMHAIMGLMGMALKRVFLILIIAVGVVILFYGAQWRLFAEGVDNVVRHYRGGHPAFLMGSYSMDGWWYYFPVVFLLKTPVPTLIYALVAFLFLSFRKDKAEYFLLIPIVVIVLTALESRINVGIRHILPLYPFLIVLVSSITAIQFTSPRFFLACFAALAIWYLVSTLSIFPSYVAYFNEFVGPKRGYQILVDSNLDWGQDLKRLKIYMDKNEVKQLYLSYFGTADPCYYGIRFVYLPGSPTRCDQGVEDDTADFLAISATHLQSVYLPYKSSFEWLKQYEPIAQIGYSIFVYDIREDASAHARLGNLYIKYGMIKDALSEFKLVVTLTPNQAIAHSNLGLTYALLSKPDKAREALKKAFTLDPENHVAGEWLKKLDQPLK